MKLFADENMARAIVIWLRDQGHDVLYASDIQPGRSGYRLARTTEAEYRIISISDKDFPAI